MSDQPTDRRWIEVLCQQCSGNGVIKIPGGVSQCPQCEGRCYETDLAPAGVGEPAPPPQLELGTLLDLLDMAATCIGDGRAAATDTLCCVYRDAIYEALERLRAAARPGLPTDYEVNDKSLSRIEVKCLSGRQDLRVNRNEVI